MKALLPFTLTCLVLSTLSAKDIHVSNKAEQIPKSYALSFGEIHRYLTTIPKISYIKQSAFCKSIRYVVSYADNILSNTKPYVPTPKVKMIFVAFRYRF